jgi:hypothetical protein
MSLRAREKDGEGRLRLASPATANLAGAITLLSLAALIPLQALSHQLDTSSDALQAVVEVAFGLTFMVVGMVVARREPRNPIGWLLLLAAFGLVASFDGAAYAQLDYLQHRGVLPLGQVAVLFSPAWTYSFMALPLIILLFPDGRLGAPWRWPLRAYLALFAAFAVGTLSVAVAAWRLRNPIDASGNLVGFNHPSGANAWFGPVEGAGYVSLAVLAIAAIVYQVGNYRRASGVRRQQLKWLGSGGVVCVVFLLLTFLWSNAPAIIGDLAPIGLAALPVTIGVGILRYRLYEIDRLISRTLAYALLTGLLVGTFIGLVALTTNTLALSGRVGVAASTLVAAALFNPLRVRTQRLVDRRFNRARYDAEATVAAFTARLRDAVEIDAIRSDLLDAVNRAVQPSQASIWIKS